jgi:hypothetical protein
MAQRKETVVDLAKFIDKGVHVKLSGGREGACPRARGRQQARPTSALCCAPRARRLRSALLAPRIAGSGM